MSLDPAIEAAGVALRRGRWSMTLDHLRLARGETLAVLGPNGAGKSTLLHALALLEPITAGTIRVGGTPAATNPLAARRRMAVVLQQPLLLDGSARHNVELGLRLHGTARAERARRAALWMERTGIAALAGRRARSLSGGEQRRVSLARALALEPLVLFLDEPFAALDAPGRQAMLDELPRWLRAAGCATVFVTHDREEALHLADTVAVMLDGTVHQYGPADEVFTAPVSAAVARFLGYETLVEGEAVPVAGGSKVAAGGARLRSTAVAAGPVLVAIHPESIQVMAAMEGSALPSCAAGNRLTARVTAVEPAGSRWRLRLDAGFPLVALVPRAGAHPGQPRAGDLVHVQIAATRVHLIRR